MLEGKYNPTTLEPQAQALWEELGVHRYDPEAPGEVFSIDTPPPTVSGKLHIGHVFSYTQAECIARYMRMRGRNVFYPFGFDDNGLPTERLTERDHKVLGREMPREEFVALCRETSDKYKQDFEQLWRVRQVQPTAGCRIDRHIRAHIRGDPQHTRALHLVEYS